MDHRDWGNNDGSGSNPGGVNDFGNFAGWLESEIFQPNLFNTTAATLQSLWPGDLWGRVNLRKKKVLTCHRN